jgi:dihydropteroate synthase
VRRKHEQEGESGYQEAPEGCSARESKAQSRNGEQENINAQEGNREVALFAFSRKGIVGDCDVVMERSFVYRFGRRTYNLSSRTHIMGILNVTPDSFSDGGKYFNPELAVDRGLQMVDEGADIIDVGGESTRPKGGAYGEGAEVVDTEEELRRVLPVISRLAKQTEVPISIDTYKSAVACESLKAGAVIVNDISGFRFDERMSDTVAQAGASVVLMHIKGTPRTMQVNPAYGDLFEEVGQYLTDSVRNAREAGIQQIIVDPGIGFGKTQQHNLDLVNNLLRFKTLGYPILVGVSRKSFIGNILSLSFEQRTEGSIAAGVIAVINGANVLRVHDVKETKRAVMVADAIIRAGRVE